MQPRRLLWPRLLTVFQVTKRGCSSCFFGGRGEACWERRAKEKKEELEEDLDVSPRAACEEVAERDEGVEEDEAVDGEDAWRRDMLGRRRVEDEGSESSSSASLSSRSSSSSSSSSAVSSVSGILAPSSEDWYAAHSSSTWLKLSDSRFSKLADRTSKQNSACAVVAMLSSLGRSALFLHQDFGLEWTL